MITGLILMRHHGLVDMAPDRESCDLHSIPSSVTDLLCNLEQDTSLICSVLLFPLPLLVCFVYLSCKLFGGQEQPHAMYLYSD